MLLHYGTTSNGRAGRAQTDKSNNRPRRPEASERGRSNENSSKQHLEYWDGEVVGMCGLWSITGLNQEQEQKARSVHRRPGQQVNKGVLLFKDDDLDTGEKLPVNPSSELRNQISPGKARQI